MALIDLSHEIGDGTITYPGLPGPVVEDHLTRDKSERSYSPGVRFHIGRISMVANTGTYLDTPFHRFDDGHDLAAVPLDDIAGLRGVVIDAGRDASGRVDPALFDGHDFEGAAVLVRTGWDRHWGTPAYADGHPWIDGETAERLVVSGARLAGIDSLNIDATDDGRRPAHTALLGAGVSVVEHLCNLDALDADRPFRFTAVPVKVVGMGTFPVRAFAEQQPISSRSEC